MLSNPLAFDELLALAQNPKALEAFREREIQAVIEQAPEYMRHRLEGLQFQIDAQRQLHKDSPLGACIKLSAMMQDSFQHLQQSLQEMIAEADSALHPLDNPTPTTDNSSPPQPESDCKIIPFPLQD